MSKIIGLKNTTLLDIDLTELGETIPVNQGSPEQILDMSNTASFHFRKVANLKSLIDIGDVVVSNGIDDLDVEEGYAYLVDDVTGDDDGFWYTKRRRFSVKSNSTAHGYFQGEVIYLDSSGATQLAIATSAPTSSTSAVISEVVDVDNFYSGSFGTIVTPAAGSIVGGLPLTVGTSYYLSATQAGKLTSIPPGEAGDIVKLIALSINPTELLIFNYPGYENITALSASDITKLQNGSQFISPHQGWIPAVIDVVDDPVILTPITGDRYIVGSGVGVWAGNDNNIAEYNASSGAWYYTSPVIGDFTYNKTLQKLLKFDGTSWVVALQGSSSTTPAICHRHNGSITQTFTHSRSTILIGTDVKTDASTYNVANNEVEVLAAGWYRIEYEVSAEAVYSERSSMEHRLEKNSDDIYGSLSYSYHRTSSSGEDTAHATIWVELAINDKIRITSKELIGGTKTLKHACRLTLEYYG